MDNVLEIPFTFLSSHYTCQDPVRVLIVVGVRKEHAKDMTLAAVHVPHATSDTS